MAKNSAVKKEEVMEESEQPTTPTEVNVPVDEKGRKTSVNLSMEEVEKKGWKNKSQIIRGLDGEGFSRSAIAKFLGIKYQHVRNVLVQPLKRPAEAPKQEG